MAAITTSGTPGMELRTHNNTTSLDGNPAQKATAKKVIVTVGRGQRIKMTEAEYKEMYKPKTVTSSNLATTAEPSAAATTKVARSYGVGRGQVATSKNSVAVKSDKTTKMTRKQRRLKFKNQQRKNLQSSSTTQFSRFG